MSKQRKYISFFAITLLLGLLFFIEMETYVDSNPIYAFKTPTGGLLPGNYTTELQMMEANVLMEIDNNVHEYYSNRSLDVLFDVSFDGNYTIYNSDVSVEMLIGAPFYTIFFDDLDGIVDNMNVEVGGISKEFEIISFLELNATLDEPWRYYFSRDDIRHFILCNITFEGYSNTSIRYSFDSTFTIFSLSSYLWIEYDVGTARAWKGVTTEQVEFKTYGRQPDAFSDESLDPTTKFTITDIDNGKSYLWQWEATTISENSVGIKYTFHSTARTTSNFYLSILAVLLILNRSAFSSKKRKL